MISGRVSCWMIWYMLNSTRLVFIDETAANIGMLQVLVAG
jgi:hypothetical protein